MGQGTRVFSGSNTMIPPENRTSKSCLTYGCRGGEFFELAGDVGGIARGVGGVFTVGRKLQVVLEIGQGFAAVALGVEEDAALIIGVGIIRVEFDGVIVV